MIVKVRRRLSSIVFYGVWAAFTLYETLTSESPATFAWGLQLVVAVALIVRGLSKKYYFEFDGSKLTIYRFLFSTRTIDAANIAGIEIEDGFFSSSKIFLKDSNEVIRFNYDNAHHEDFIALLHALKVPVK